MYEDFITEIMKNIAADITHKMIHSWFDTDIPLHTKNLHFYFILSSIITQLTSTIINYML